MACFASCDDGGGLVLWTRSPATGGQRDRFAARRLLPADQSDERTTMSWAAIAFSPDSRVLACAGVVDGAGGKEGVARTLSLLATTSDDASADDGDVVCSRCAGPELRCPDAGFTAVAWVRDPKLRLVTGASSGVVAVWDYLRGEVLWKHPKEPYYDDVSVALLDWAPGGDDSSPDGSLVVVSTHYYVKDPDLIYSSEVDEPTCYIDFYCRTHESNDDGDYHDDCWAEQRALVIPGEVCSLCLAAMTVAVYQKPRHTIVVYSLNSGRILQLFRGWEFRCWEVPRMVQLSPDGSKLVGRLDGLVWDTRTGEPAFHLQTDPRETGLSQRTCQLNKWCPDGTSSLLTVTKDDHTRSNVFRLWDTAANPPAETTPLDSSSKEEESGRRCLMMREFEKGHRRDSTITNIAWSSADVTTTTRPPQRLTPSPRASSDNDDRAPPRVHWHYGYAVITCNSAPLIKPRPTAANAASNPTSSMSTKARVDSEIKKMLKGFKMQASDEAFKKSLSSMKFIGRGSRGALNSVSKPEETLQQLRNLLVVGDSSRSAVRAKEHKQLIAQALQELLNVTIEADGPKPGMGAEGSSSNPPEMKAFMAHYADTWIKAAVLAYALLELQLKRKSQNLKRQQNRREQQESGGADSSRRPVIAPSNPLSASAHARGAAPTSSSSPMAAAVGGISSAGADSRRPPLSSPLDAAKVVSPQPTLPATSSAGRSRFIQQDATPAALASSLRFQHQSPSSSTPTKLTSANTTKPQPHVTASPSNSAAAPNAEHRRTSAATQRQPSPSLPIPPSPHFDPHVKSEPMTECEIGTQRTDEQQEGGQRAQPGKQESMSAPTVASTLANAPDHERKLSRAGASASSMSRALVVQDGRTDDGPSGTAGTSNKRPASDSLTAIEHGGGEDGGSRKLARVESMSRTDASAGRQQRPPSGVSGTEEELERSTRSDGGADGSGDMDSDVEEEAVVQAGAVGGGGSGTTPPSNDRALSRAESEYVPILTVELPESQALDDDLDATLSSPAGEGVSVADGSGAGASAVAGERAGDDADAGGNGSNKRNRLTSPVVYPKQKEVASELLLKMEHQIGKSGVDEFDQLAFFIQVPNLNSLLGQTLTRVGEFLEAHRAVDSAFFPELVPEEVVYKGAPASSWVTMFEGIKERIRTEPKTLFLFVHDEAHWSPTVGTAGYFINDDLLRRSPNVFTLFVSATPYNLLTQDSQVPEENEHQWFTPNEITSYYGLKRYLEPQQEGICNVGGATATPPLALAAAAPLRGCPPGSIVKDTLLYNAAEAKMPLPQKLREAWLTGKHAEAEYAEDEASMNKSAQLRKLKTLMALEVRYVAAFLQAMGRLPSELPAGATLSMPDSSPLPELPENDLTLEMVRQLVSPAPNGRGIMILLRVADHKSGRLLYNSIRRVRGFLGLQSRIAVIIDINQTEAARSDDTSFGLKETIEPPLLRRLLQLQVASGVVGPEADAPLVRQYSDLDGLPCVLILCEKGKMGDTFPPSLRFYDLRLRYINNCNERAATEQDLGRAFRYHNPGGAAGCAAELPTIIVSQQLYNALMGKRGGRRGLLRYDPARPDLMRSVGGKKAHSYPDQGGPHPESDTAAYRAHWAAGPKHFDNKENRAKAEGCWLANPRRFVLAAAPQIGKTGAFLHLIYLLWCRYIPRRAIEPTPPPLLPSPSSDATNSSLSSEHTNGGTGDSSAAHMALFPSSALLSSSPASFPAGSDAHVARMYGDPSRSPEYDWYMAGNRGRCPFATPAAAVDEGGREEGLLPMRFSAQPSLVASVESRWTGRSAEVRLPSFQSTTRRDRMEGPSSAAEAMVVGRLHIPHSHDVANAWLPDFPSSFKLQPPAAASNAAEERRGSVLRTPIFVPSCGRPAAALLDLAAAMEDWDYLQVVVVKSEELASYMAHWPGHVFFELPPEASALGIGAARFAIYHLAEQMVGSPNAGGCRCAYLLDDRLLAWKIDVGLDNDPYAAHMKTLAMSSCTPGIKQPEGRLSSIPMPVALSFMEAATDLSRVGVVGFRCYGGGPVHWREAYARSPVGSAVLLNLSELTRAGVVYDPSLFAWEDIDLSRRASGQERAGVAAAKPPGLVVAECRRFVVVKKVIPKGGCVDNEEGDIELEDISASTDETEWPSEEGEEGGSRVALRSLSHLQVGRFVEWALGEVWGAPHQRAAQHVVAQRVVSLGIDGSVLEEETDIVDELASELKGASRRAALREAIDAAKAAGGIPQEVVDAWDAVPADQSLPATSP